MLKAKNGVAGAEDPGSAADEDASAKMQHIIDDDDDEQSKSQSSDGFQAHELLIQELERSLTGEDEGGSIIVHSSEDSDERFHSTFQSFEGRRGDDLCKKRPQDSQDRNPHGSSADCRTRRSSSSRCGGAFHRAGRVEWGKKSETSADIAQFATRPVAQHCPCLSCHSVPYDLDYGTRRLSCMKLGGSGKHLLRAVAGGSPLLLCPACVSLLRMPTGVRISRTKPSTVRCGCCCRLLKFRAPPSEHRDGQVATISDPGCATKEFWKQFSWSIPGVAEAIAARKPPGAGSRGSDGALHRLMGYTSVSGLLRSRVLS